MANVFRVAFELGVFDALNRRVQLFGDRFTPTTITPTLGVVYDATDVIPDASGRDTLWVTEQGGINTFEYMFLLSDVDVYVELVNTTPDPDERAIVFVKGGVPLVVPGGLMGGHASNTTRLDGVALVLGTDYGNITVIRVQNDAEEGAGDATVRLILVG